MCNISEKSTDCRIGSQDGSLIDLVAHPVTDRELHPTAGMKQSTRLIRAACRSVDRKQGTHVCGPQHPTTLCAERDDDPRERDRSLCRAQSVFAGLVRACCCCRLRLGSSAGGRWHGDGRVTVFAVFLRCHDLRFMAFCNDWRKRAVIVCPVLTVASVALCNASIILRHHMMTLPTPSLFFITNTSPQSNT